MSVIHGKVFEPTKKKTECVLLATSSRGQSNSKLTEQNMPHTCGEFILYLFKMCEKWIKLHQDPNEFVSSAVFLVFINLN